MVNDYEDEGTSIHIVGFPMLMGWIYSYKTQMLWVFGLSVALMVLLLFLVFRSLVGMIAPFTMVVICTGLGLGFIGWAGINFSPLLYVLAFLVGARMLSNAVQITHRYIQEYHSCSESATPRRTAAYNTMRAMIMPNAAAVATDAAGFMVLGFAKIVLMQQVAIIMTFWMLTIILEGIMVPIICSYLPRLAAQASENGADVGWLDKTITAVSSFSMSSGKYLISSAAIAVVVFGGWQTTSLKIGDPTPGSPILWPEHPYNRDQSIINETFNASSETFMLFYEGTPQSVYDPIVPKTFEAFARHMAKRLPDIYKSSSSINNLGKMINLTFHDGHYLWYQIPRDPVLLTGLLGYVRQNIDRGTLGRFMDTTQERAQITLFFSDHTSDNMLRIREAAYDFFKEYSETTEHGQFYLAGGAIGMEIAVNEEMRRAHILMDSMVLVTIFVMCTLSFRSFVAGAMLTLPLILSNLVAFAYMALTGIGLSTNTLPCAAVGVGVGVDFSIYLYSRCVEEFARCRDFRKTVSTAVRTTGKGILFTGITLILPILLWYYISALKFQAQMGFFLSMLLFTNLVAVFTLHPLLIIIIRPKFMQKAIVPTE
jgi:predicted RND superfamily exporter protein